MNVKEIVTEKLGPFPAWAWVGIGVGAYLLLTKLKGSNGQSALGTIQSYVPQTSAGNSGFGTTTNSPQTPVSLSCPGGQVLDPTGTFCVPNLSLCGPGTQWQNGTCVPTTPPPPGNTGGCPPAITPVNCGPNQIMIPGIPIPGCTGSGAGTCIDNPAVIACQGAGGTWANGTCSFPQPPIPQPPPPPPPPPPPIPQPPSPPPPTPGPPVDPCAGQTGVLGLMCQAGLAGAGQGVCDPGYIQFAGQCIPSAASLISQLPVYQVAGQGVPGCCLTSYISPQAACGPGVVCPGGSPGAGNVGFSSNNGPVNSGAANYGSLSNASTFTPVGQGSIGQIVGGPGPGVLFEGGQWIKVA